MSYTVFQTKSQISQKAGRWCV